MLNLRQGSNISGEERQLLLRLPTENMEEIKKMGEIEASPLLTPVGRHNELTYS